MKNSLYHEMSANKQELSSLHQLASADSDVKFGQHYQPYNMCSKTVH